MRFAIYFFIFVLFAVSGFGQSAGTGLFEQPERLELTGWAEPDPDIEPTSTTFITTSFYPIGWSRDGKFAYLIEPPDEACGCYFAEIVIQDLVNDKVVWSERYSSELLEDPETENLNTYWAAHQKKFSAKLNEFRIIASSRFDLLGPTVGFGNDVFTSVVKVDVETDNDLEVIGDVTVRLHSKRRGSKVIHRDVYKKGEISGFRNAMIAGSLKSPFESRIAVIIVEEHRGWEGPPNTTGVKVAGASLTTGFERWAPRK